MKILIMFCMLFALPSLNSFASESSVYDFSWLDSDKEVYVLQNRKYRKDGRLYIGGTFGKSLSGAFIDSYQGTLLGGYFFNENWGLELSYTKAQGSTNATHNAVNSQAGSVAFYRKIDTQMSAMLVWSPFYGKLNTFNKIFYFDWLFGIGPTSVSSLDNRNEFLPAASQQHSVLTKETVNGLTWMIGWRFYISDGFSFRTDFTAVHLLNVSAATGLNETKSTTDNKYNINFGINYAF